MTFRPCSHPTGPPQPETGCRVCQLYVSEPAYRTLYDSWTEEQFRAAMATGHQAPAAPKPMPKCPHLWKRVRLPDGKTKTRDCKG